MRSVNPRSLTCLDADDLQSTGAKGPDMRQASHSGRVYRCPDGPSLPPTGGHPFFPPDASVAQVLHPTAEAVLRAPASSTPPEEESSVLTCIHVL